MATLWLLVYRSAYSRVYRSSKIAEIYEPLSQHYQRLNTKLWLGRQDSNLGMAESKSAALPLGYAPNTGGPPFSRFGASQQQGNRGVMTRCGARVTRRSRKFAQLEFFGAGGLALPAREFYTGASLVIGV
jgi:hypothetical protein